MTEIQFTICQSYGLCSLSPTQHALAALAQRKSVFFLHTKKPLLRKAYAQSKILLFIHRVALQTSTCPELSTLGSRSCGIYLILQVPGRKLRVKQSFLHFHSPKILVLNNLVIFIDCISCNILNLGIYIFYLYFPYLGFWF